MPTPKTAINMARPMSLYALTLGLLMMLALLASNVPPLSLSYYLDIPFRKALCLSFLAIGGASGLVALYKHQQRVEQPWRVHQTLVSLLYMVFVLFSILGVVTIR